MTSRPHERPARRLEGKTAIVTGGGSFAGQVGTGRATAVCLAAEGARVIVADINAENAERTVAEVRDEIGGEAAAFVGDATRSEDSVAMIGAAVERYGGLHVLVNNLGFGGRSIEPGVSRRISDIDEAEWDRCFDLNLKSAMLATKYAIPAMIDSGGGSIINISSCDAIAGATHLGAPYSVSKGALHMLTRGTAAWHGRDGIRANCIAPGHLRAPFVERFPDELHKRRQRVVPLGTEGTAWDVAWAVVYLGSDESRWVSGIILPVDGGLFAAQPLLGRDMVEGDFPFGETENK